MTVMGWDDMKVDGDVAVKITISTESDDPLFKNDADGRRQ